jgi:transcription initiation factor TFIID subunit 1, fungi type
MADNSTSVLLEYSLEQPLIMSQVGMGNKIVNYYRRKTKEDSSRPKHDLGETNVLLPEDKSPFYMFGHIEPGEEVTALYNSMYRAPIFEQDMKRTDFLVARETTGTDGQRHYLRTVDNLFTVGQELPSVAIPGSHSRMVTTTDKNRLKAISYRVARRKKSNRIRVEDITKHFQGTTDMQNRQKMKEFMVFNKEHKEWEMKGNEPLPDEEAIRQMIRPEDICLLEAMLVGDKFMRDAGYGTDEDEEKDKGDDTETLEQLLTPWRVTKTFMQATQGKAMVRVWGEGDPSGRDEAFSFIRTNMKGGYAPRGAPIQDTLTKENNTKPGSHRYNVAEQQQRYDRDIRDTWDNQKAALSSKVEPSDPDAEGDVDAMDDLRGRGSQRGTPMSTPAPNRHVDHETGTSFSKRSVGSQVPKYLRITREVMEDGENVLREYLETDAAVIKAYMRARKIKGQGDEE